MQHRRKKYEISYKDVTKSTLQDSIPLGNIKWKYKRKNNVIQTYSSLVNLKPQLQSHHNKLKISVIKMCI